MTPLNVSQLLQGIFQSDVELIGACDNNIWYIRAENTSRVPFVVYTIDSQVPIYSDYVSSAVSCNWEVNASVNIWAETAAMAEEIGRIVTRIAHGMQTGQYKGIKYAEIEDRYTGIELAPQPFPLYRFTVNIRIIV